MLRVRLSADENCRKYALTRKTRLFLVIENRMLREAITSIFHRQSEFSVVGSIRYGAGAFRELTAASQCDILLADQASALRFRLAS